MKEHCHMKDGTCHFCHLCDGSSAGEFHLSVPAQEVLHLLAVHVRRVHQSQATQGAQMFM